MSPGAIVYPGGSFTPRESLTPCGDCGATRLEVVRIWLAVRDLDGRPAERESISAQCPACLPLVDGRNRHGKKERRQALGWLDARTGQLTMNPRPEAVT